MSFQLLPSLQLNWKIRKIRRRTACHECRRWHEAGSGMLAYKYNGKYQEVQILVCATGSECACDYEKKWLDHLANRREPADTLPAAR